jgi:isoquinoline 1-oxidoreductase beta subunit
MLGGLTDAISTTLNAGLHIAKGLPLEGSYSQFHYARQKNSPRSS